MLIFQRMVFVSLLASLQWISCNGIPSIIAPSTSFKNSGITPKSISESAETVATRKMSPTVTSAVTEYDTQSNSITPLSTLNKTAQKFSTEDIAQSFTSNNGIPFSSEITTTNLLTISESYTDAKYVIQSETAPNSFSPATYDISVTTMAFTSDIQTNNVTTTSNYTTSANTTSAKAVLTTNIQTTSRNPSILHSSAEVHESTKENPSNGGVILGAIVGAVLGCALIGLVGYFMCAKRKFQGFVHQRLYDDMTNDPVLRLDSVPESYGVSTADLSYYNPTMANETTTQNSNTPYDAISMDDMTLSPHLP